jgi:hypothetical protein
MKKEYNISKGVRGKFYGDTIRLHLPIYLDKDLEDVVRKVAKQKKIDSQTIVNTLLRDSKELIQAMR